MAEERNRLKLAIPAMIVVAVVLALALHGWTRVSFPVEFEDANEGSYWPWVPEYPVVDREKVAHIPDAEAWDILFSGAPTGQPLWEPDFDNYTYALLDWGEKPSSGYAIGFLNVTYCSGVLEFRYYMISPGPDDNVMTVITHPHALIQISRSQFAEHPVRDWRFVPS